MSIVTDAPAAVNGRPRKADIYSKRARKPCVLRPDLDAIPGVLRGEARWMLWKLVWRGAQTDKGAWTKMPYRPDKQYGSSTNPSTWGAFARIRDAYTGSTFFTGVGFALGDGWCGIDLDDVRDPDTGAITPEAAALVERVATYAEVSPSGTGLKLIGRGTWTGKKNRYPMPGGGELEVYDSGRYFTVTGDSIGNRPVADVTAALAELAVELDGPEEEKPKPDTTDPKQPNPESNTPEGADTDSTTDGELIERMTAAANGAKFLDLWNCGDGDAPSASEADLALCSLIAFWTGPDAAHIDRLFRRSKRLRDKWDERRGERTYGQLTIAKALANRTEYYADEATATEPADAGSEEPTVTPNATSKTGAGTAKNAERKKPKSPRAPGAANVLTTIGARFDLWHDDTQVGFATTGRVSYPIRSRAFKLLLVKEYRGLCNSTPNAEAVNNALTALEATAIHDRGCYAAHVRVAGHEEKLYLHIADAASTVIEIDTDGWRVCAAPPVRFVKRPGMKPLPVPVPGGTVGELRRFVPSADEASFALSLAWLTAALRPVGPYPLMALTGEQGSAKSTTSRTLRALVDPNASLLRSEPKEARDLMIASRGNWVLAFDNLSYLPPWLSDALCRLATGGGFATRSLFTDDEEAIFDSQRPVVLNGIDDFVNRGDLLERSLLVRLPSISAAKRMTESDYWSAFKAAHPRLLGALLDRVSAGLRTLPAVKLDKLPRMADFALWSIARERGAGEESRFVEAYTANATEAAEQAIEVSPVPSVLRSALGARTEWEATARALLTALEEHVRTTQPRTDGRKQDALTSREWPQNPIALGNKLRRLAPAMREVMGLDVTFKKSNGTRLVVIKRTVERKTATDATSPPRATRAPDTEETGSLPPTAKAP